jgi:hypothetical protein
VPPNQAAVRIQLELTCETLGGFFSTEANWLYGIRVIGTPHIVARDYPPESR